MAQAASRSNRASRAVNKKTRHLIEVEGKSPEQAYAMANAMKRAGRLTAEGGYRRVKKGR